MIAGDVQAGRIAEDWLHEHGWPHLRVDAATTPRDWLHAVTTRGRMPHAMHGALIERWVSLAVERASAMVRKHLKGLDSVHWRFATHYQRPLTEARALLAVHRQAQQGSLDRRVPGQMARAYRLALDEIQPLPLSAPAGPRLHVHQREWSCSLADLRGVLLHAPLDRASWKVARVLAGREHALVLWPELLRIWLAVVRERDARLRA